MGTRADFYIGKGATAEWLGSIAWDGYRDGIPDTILLAKSNDAFRASVAEFLATREDGMLPEHGWPWPWDDSGTTDCSYWHFDGRTWDAFGDCYVPSDEPEPKEGADGERINYPDMSASKNVTFGKRSGVMIFTSRG